MPLDEIHLGIDVDSGWRALNAIVVVNATTHVPTPIALVRFHRVAGGAGDETVRLDVDKGMYLDPVPVGGSASTSRPIAAKIMTHIRQREAP
jgi:hypothetical protein